MNDIDFPNSTVTFRTNQWRRLKTRRSTRTIPLWPQLAEILRAYIKATGRKAGLLFPSPFLDEPGLVRIGGRRWTPSPNAPVSGRLATCARRCSATPIVRRASKTLDGERPVAVFTVSREMGHSTTKMVEAVYGHVAGLPHRSSVVEYRVQQHRAKLVTYLKLLKSD